MHEQRPFGTVTPGDFLRIREVFEAALEQPSADRRQYVEQACGGNTLLVAEVERMLAAEAEPDVLLDRGDGRARPSACPSCHGPLAPTNRFCPACGTPTEGSGTDEGRFRAGALFANRFRIVARLGRGGMGEVYRADDLELGQPVALKFLSVLRSDDRARTRLRNEVRLARQLAHPNVCRVYDIGESHGELYLSMEYVDGEDLAALLTRIGRVPIDKGIEIARKLCAGLAAAHAKGVLHRDFKPANIMLDSRGEVRIMDFGLAAIASDLDERDVRSGTPAYMAPEQLAGKEATKHSDLYALGLVLYELFTGKPPFEAKTAQEYLRLREASHVTKPSTLIPEIGERLEGVILRCLDPDPRQRPASALDISASLPGVDPLAEALAAGETPSPELIAASGPTEGLQIRTASMLLACIAVCFGAAVLLSPRTSMIAMLPFRDPPQVLTVRARDIVRSLGYQTAPVDSAGAFQIDSKHIDHLRESIGASSSPRADWVNTLRNAPWPISFWYRESPVPLVPTISPGVLRRARLNDPRADTPGMVAVVVDLEGRLVRFSATPQAGTSAEVAAQMPDWRVPFAAAGLDMSRFTPVTPEAPAATINDAQRAWTGTMPQSRVPVRVEAAAFRGRVSRFDLTFPWVTRTGKDRFTISTTDSLPSSPQPLPLPSSMLGVILLASVAIVARHNVRRNRSDIRGAYRLGLFFGVTMSLLWILGTRHVSLSLTMNDLLQNYVPQFFYSSFFSALFYLAIEPWVRRYWPETMITWSRALSGRWRDAVAARDVLVGLACGTVSTLSLRLATLVLMAFGSSPSPPQLAYSPLGLGLEKLLGGPIMTADMLSFTLQGYATAMQYFFLLFLFRVLLRKPWLSAIACFAFNMVFYGMSYVAAFGMQAVMYLAIVTSLSIFVSMRLGLLATLVFVTTAMFTDGFVLTPNLGAWYGQSSLLASVVVAAVALWAFRTSLGGRPVLALAAGDEGR